MKKLLTLLLSMCMLLCVGIGLIGCGGNGDEGNVSVGDGGEHTHSYLQIWSYNDTHHWRKCQEEDCLSIADEARHDWNDGEIEGEAIIYTCKVCPATKAELMPTKMDQAEWEEMLLYENFENFSLNWSSTVEQMSGEYVVKFDDGVLQYDFIVDNQTVESKIIPDNANPYEYIEVARAMVLASYPYAEYDFSNDQYVVSETVNTSYGYETGAGNWITIEVAMTDGVIKATNDGKLLSLSCNYTETANGRTISYENAVWIFSNYGTTQIELPAEQLEYEINEDGNTCTIIGLGGILDKNVVIPNEINGYTVTAIDESAFAWKEISSVVIPDNVTEIGEYAFSGCGITEITIGKGITSIDTWGLDESLEKVNYTGSVKDWAQLEQSISLTQYAGDLHINGVKVTSVDLTGVDAVSSGAFYNCKSITEINLTNVTTIGNKAFFGCSSLAEVSIPSSVTSLGYWAFAKCTGLQSVFYDVVNQSDYSNSPFLGVGTKSGGVAITIGKNVEKVPAKLFYRENPVIKSIEFENNSSLKSIGEYAFYTSAGYRQSDMVIPDGVTEIGKSAFGYTYETGFLQSVTLPASLTSLSYLAFYQVVNENTELYYKGLACDWACDIDFGGDSVLKNFGDFYVNGTLLETFGNDILYDNISDYAFKGCKSLKEINIPSSVQSIGEQAFSDCPNLESVYTAGGNTLRSIGDYAFSGNDKLKSVEIRQIIQAVSSDDFGTELGFGIFSGDTSLETVYLQMTNVPAYMFNECKSLREVTFHEEANITGIAVNLTQSTITSIGNYAFYYCENITSICIPENVESIGSWAFYGCERMTEILNKSALSLTAGSNSNGYVAKYAVSIYTAEEDRQVTTDANGYKIYTVGEDKILIGYVGDETQLVIPEGVTKINENLFKNNKKITGITLPSTLTAIGYEAFLGCTNLVEICNLSSTSITVGSNSFNDNTVSYIARYAKVVYTEAYTSRVSTDSDGYVIYDDGIDKILLYYSGKESRLTLPVGITVINQGAFSNRSDITSVVIPDNVKTIEKTAFENCRNLETVTFGEGLEEIGYCAFSGCSSLERVTLGDNVRTIGQEAFSGCSNVTVVTLGNVVENIGQSAFTDCSSLESIVIPDSVVVFESFVFANCSSLKTVIIGSGVQNIKTMSFANCYALKNVTIGVNVTTIEQQAFMRCTSLNSIVIPEKVNSIETNAFFACYGLIEVYNLSNMILDVGADANGRVSYYAKTVNTSLDVQTKIATDSQGFVIYANGEDKILLGFVGEKIVRVLPDGITEIYGGALDWTKSLGYIIVPETVKVVNEKAFSDYSNLNRIYFEGTAENMPEGASNWSSWYCYSEDRQSDGKYWHYDVDNITPVDW